MCRLAALKDLNELPTTSKELQMQVMAFQLRLPYRLKINSEKCKTKQIKLEAFKKKYQ